MVADQPTEESTERTRGLLGATDPRRDVRALGRGGPADRGPGGAGSGPKVKDARRFEQVGRRDRSRAQLASHLRAGRAAETSRLLWDDVGESVGWWHVRSTAMPNVG